MPDPTGGSAGRERWQIQLFGSLSATKGTQVVARFRTRKTGALLGYLALHPGIAHRRELLCDLLWPEDPSRCAHQSLSMALSWLRQQLESPGEPAGNVLAADRTTILLHQAAATTDVAHFETCLAKAQAAPGPEVRAICLLVGIGLYEGPLLASCEEDWLVPERLRLADRFEHAVGQVAHLARPLPADPPEFRLGSADAALLADRLGPPGNSSRMPGAAIESGLRLLAPDARTFLAALATLGDGWSLADAEAAAGGSGALERLAQLVDCALVQAHEAGGGMHFEMPAALRRVAAVESQG